MDQRIFSTIYIAGLAKKISVSSSHTTATATNYIDLANILNEKYRITYRIVQGVIFL